MGDPLLGVISQTGRTPHTPCAHLGHLAEEALGRSTDSRIVAGGDRRDSIATLVLRPRMALCEVPRRTREIPWRATQRVSTLFMC